MKAYLILIPILFLALLQGAFLPLNLVLLLVLFWAAWQPEKESLLLSFFAGIFLDLAKGSSLGLSSLILLLTSYLLLLYRRKLDPFSSVFLPVFVFLASSLYSWISGRFSWREALILALLAFWGRLVWRNFSLGADRGAIRLKV